MDDVYSAFENQRKKADAISADQQDLEELEADAKLISLEKK